MQRDEFGFSTRQIGDGREEREGIGGDVQWPNRSCDVDTYQRLNEPALVIGFGVARGDPNLQVSFAPAGMVPDASLGRRTSFAVEAPNVHFVKTNRDRRWSKTTVNPWHYDVRLWCLIRYLDGVAVTSAATAADFSPSGHECSRDAKAGWIRVWRRRILEGKTDVNHPR